MQPSTGRDWSFGEWVCNHHGMPVGEPEVLRVGGVSVADAVAATGTPAYVYALDDVEAAYRRVAAAFAPMGAEVLYAVKANGNLAVLRRLAAAGCGFTVVSGGELTRVLAAGPTTGTVVLAGRGTSAEEHALAVRHGAVVHVQSADELAALGRVAAELGRPARVAIRLNPDVEAASPEALRTGHGDAAFGMPPEVAVDALGRMAAGAHPGLVPVGVHVHVGSQIRDPSGVASAVKVALDVIRAGRDAGLDLDWLDAGGGFPVDESGADVPEPEDFAALLAPLVEGTGVRLAVEPGRRLVASAGMLVTSVRHRLDRSHGRTVVVDAGMHHLLRPALYGATHRVVAVGGGSEDVAPTTVVGPCCEPGDVLARAAPLPALAPGDLVAVLDAGAYGMVMASNYNGHPRPAEVVVAGGEATVARRRETWDDLLAWET
jgi:diaminopimelate decarboxylase